MPFTTSELFAHFNRIADAPDAIPRLRRFILELAVRGKLVEQDPNDEPASELLKRIQAEKARLVKEGKIRKQDKQPEIEANALPFPLPNLWTNARLGDVIHLVSGQHLQPGEYSNQEQSGPPYITGPADFGESGLVITRYATVRKAVATAGQILLTVKGAGVGKTAICDLPEVAISRQLMAMTSIEWSQRFLLLITHRLATVLKESARSLIPGISREDVDLFVFGLPPLAEQHRIVAKVDELMALCDRLEAAQAERERRRERLAAASLHRLNNGADASDFRAHARFHLDHLARFTTRPDQIPALRQTILNLAVRGKLVPQDPGDASAVKLAERIAEDKRTSLKHKGIRPLQDHLAVSAEDVTFSIPESWHWMRLGTISHRIIDGNYGEKYPKKSEFISEGIPFLTSAAVGLYGNILDEEVKHISPKKHAELIKAQCTVGDVLITNRGARVGAAALLTDPRYIDCNIGPQLTSIRTNPNFVDPRYLLICLQSPSFQTVFETTNSGTAMNFVNLTKTANVPLPLAPFAEQHRIVAKVEELLALCDQLEAQLTNTQTESRRLLEAVLHEALAPAA